MPRQSVHFISILRGVAPIIVLVAHLGGTWLWSRQESSWLYGMWYNYFVVPLHLYQGGGHLGVVIFFLISGFIISYVSVRETRPEFAFKRVFRLLPTLAIGVLFMWVAAASTARYNLGSIIGNTAQSPLDYLKSMFLLNWFIPGAPNALSVTWTLFTEVTFYALVFALLPLMKARPVIATMAMCVLAFGLIAAYPLSAMLTHLTYLTMYLPLLIIGRIFYLEWSREIRAWQAWGAVAIVFAGFVAIYTARWPGQMFYPGFEPIFTYLIAIIVFYVAMKAPIQSVSPIFSFLADISYALYMLHLPVGVTVMLVATAAGATFPIAFVLGCAGSIAVATVVTKFFERPVQNICRDLLRARRKVLMAAAPGH